MGLGKRGCPKIGKRVTHRELDRRWSRDGDVKVGVTSLFMSEA